MLDQAIAECENMLFDIAYADSGNQVDGGVQRVQVSQIQVAEFKAARVFAKR
jgi:hypothetical protein